MNTTPKIGFAMNDEFHSWLIESPGYASTVTYATPVCIEQVKHDYPQMEATPLIDINYQYVEK